MKRYIVMALIAMMTAIGADAQTNLVGRVYHNSNIMSGAYKDIDKLVAQKKAEALEKLKKKEQEKGKKLPEADMKKFNEEMKNLEAKIRAIKSGTSMAMTITFKDDKTATVKAKMKMSDDAMKAADIGWLKRKAMKAAMAIAPAEDMSYTIKGNMVILNDGEESDTLQLSADGKSLSGLFKGKKKSENIRYALTRTK